MTLSDVGAAHALDADALARYLRGQIDGVAGDLTIRQFTDGQSNPTFQLITGDARYVLRKKPPGDLLPSAHAVDREYRVMAALQGAEVPVPRMLHLCLDRDVIGTEFYVMEMVEGQVFQDPSLPGLTPDQRRAFYDSFIRALAA
ncbi:phosphotransferase, partial [Jannaschia sp.]|nr:phosphotransferase [Jannaschia sp.]